jgi:hypothetical protein
MNAIPDSLRTRIQKLLALANDARGNEHKAQAAAAKVQTLLAEYNLEMSQIVDTDEDDIDPNAIREKVENALTTTTDWQRSLLNSICCNNFVMRIYDWGTDGKSTYSLIGRKLNTSTTIQVYTYLTGAIDRLCPFTDKRTKSHRSWKEGCAERLAARLDRQRWEAEAASRQQRGDAPRGNGADLVLSDVYSSEEDLNHDLYSGFEPGTTARENAANEARWKAEREARANAPAVVEPQTAETDTQRRKREAKEAADYKRWQERYARERAREAAKRDANAYAMGANAGEQISLNQQLT